MHVLCTIMSECCGSRPCPFCNFCSPDIPKWFSHIRLSHASQDSFFVRCSIGNCVNVYTSFSSWNTHVYRHHRDEVCKQPTSSGDIPSTNTSGDNQTATTVISIDQEESFVDVSEPQPPTTIESDIAQLLGEDFERQERECASFLLQMKEKHSTSQVAINAIVRGCEQLFDDTRTRIKAGVMHHLSLKGIDTSQLTEMETFMDNIRNPFSGISTPYQQQKYFRRNFNLVEPVSVNFSIPTYELTGSGAKRRQVLRQKKFYYIPLYDSLQLLLQNDVISHHIRNLHASTDHILRDFCDGAHFLEHELFSVDATALQIVGYYDELEVCNPLGSAAKKHKIGVCFFFLANLHPKWRSTLQCPQMVAVGRVADIKTFGIDFFLEPFVNDLNKLATKGITVTLETGTVTFRGTLLAFLADNLASHEVGGFKESMSFAVRFCRSCMATKDESQKYFLASSFQNRTPEEHQKQCRLLQGPLRNHHSTTYGINRKSVLEKISNFSVVTGMCHDIMHDLFEGVVPLEMKLLLAHCLEKKYFTVPELNAAISNFNFGYSNVSSRPGGIDEALLTKKDGKLRLSASSTWLLAKTLPLIIGTKVPADDPNWELYILLLKITDICTAHSCSKNTIAYLATLIEEHHSQFLCLYDRSLIPKMHYMVHYPQQIQQFGPLINAWCMRLESKLKLCKRVGKFGNFKNICLSVVNSHQRWMCMQLQTSTSIKSRTETGGKCIMRSFAEEDVKFQDLLRKYGTFDAASIVHHPAWAKVHGIVYKATGVVVVDIRDGSPIFGKIKDVAFVNESSVMLLVSLFTTKSFDTHYHAYVLNNANDDCLIHANSLCYPFVLHAHSLDGHSRDRFVCLKYGIEL